MELKFKAKDKDNNISSHVLCGNTITDDPCSAVWCDDRRKWLNFDKACGDILPYTGLKDKNGNEIYLNDDFIFTTDININGENIGKPRAKITFNLGSFGFIVNNKFYALHNWLTNSGLSIIDNCIQEIELIGVNNG